MLPGSEVQLKMSHAHRQMYSLETLKARQAKESAVLILLYEKNNEVHLVLTKRKEYNGAHSGQISLPGGKKEATDTSLAHTALRETHEEIGIAAQAIAVLGALSYLYIPVSHFVVFPYVAVCHTAPQFTIDTYEVAKIIEVPLRELLDEQNIKSKTINLPQSNTPIETPAFHIQNEVIWGATAMILSEFIAIIKN